MDLDTLLWCVQVFKIRLKRLLLVSGTQMTTIDLGTPLRVRWKCRKCRTHIFRPCQNIHVLRLAKRLDTNIILNTSTLLLI